MSKGKECEAWSKGYSGSQSLSTSPLRVRLLRKLAKPICRRGFGIRKRKSKGVRFAKANRKGLAFGLKNQKVCKRKLLQAKAN